MGFEVRTEFGNLDPEAKRALVAMQHAIKGHLDEVDRRARRPKRQVTEVVEEGGVVARPGEVVRVRPGATDVQVVLPTPDAGNGGEDIIVSFEGDGTATGKVLVTPANSTCANPGTTTLNTPGTYRFTSTGAPGENPDEQGSTWGGPAPLSLADLPEIGAQKVLGNNTGATATPIELTGSQVLDLVGSTRGSVLERGAAGWTAVTPGAIELPIVSKGAGADPVYQQLATAGIQDDAVTNAKLANMAAATIKLRASGAGTGDPTDGTITQALDMVGSTRGSLLERGAAAWQAITPGTTELPLVAKGVGADPIYQQLATAGVADDAITNAKLANMAQATVKGRASGAGTGDPTDLTGAQLATILALGWDDVLGNDAHSGANKPIIDASQYVECHTSDATQFLRIGDVGLGESFSIQAGVSSGTSATTLGVVGKNSVELRNGLSSALVHIEDDGTNAVRFATTGSRFIKVESSAGMRINNGALNTSGILSIRQSSSCPITPTADDGCYWVRGDTPSLPMFQDDTNVAIPLKQGHAEKTAASIVSASGSTLATTGTFTIPANTLRVGSRFRCCYTYRFVRGGTATALNLTSSFDIDVGVGNIFVLTASQTAAGTYYMRVEGEFTVLTTGAGGTAMAAITAWGDAHTVANGMAFADNIALAIDTTAAFDIRGAAVMSAAVAGTSIRATGGHIEWIC